MEVELDAIDFRHWPRDTLLGDYQRCAPAHPMPKGAPGKWSHAGAIVDRRAEDGGVDWYRCADCGATWPRLS